MLSNPRPRILCVEDEPDVREMLTELLKFRKIETRTVGTASEALSLIQVERFALYLLDASLPDLDGFELCRRMRDFDPHTPILFYSGAAYAADKQRAIKVGANAYVVKPDVDALVSSIMQLVFHGKCRTASGPTAALTNAARTPQ